MRALTMESTGTVFSKTEKGREEMAKRAHGLSPAQRRVLILVDGSKDCAALSEMNPALASSGQLDDILADLLEAGFIMAGASDSKSRTYPGKQAADPDPEERPLPPSVQAAVHEQRHTAAAAPPAAHAGTPSLTDDPGTIRLVKDFMTTTAQTYLGLLSAPLIQRIEQARTATQLMSVAGQWNMALRDSAQGKRFAGPYLEQVRSALASGARPALGIDD